MKKLFYLTIAFTLSLPAFSQTGTSKLQYPQTKKGNVADNYFGTTVADPYRWLEDDNSDETKAWVQSENKVTFDYLSKISYRDAIKKRITDLYNYARSTAPYREGAYYFFSKN